MEKKNDELHIVCKVRCKEGCEEEVKKYLTEMAEVSRKEEGCLYYDIFQVQDSPSEFYFLDGWQNEAAEKEHLQNPALPGLGEKLLPLYVEGPTLMRGKKI